MNIKGLIPPNRTEDECYKAGFGCGLNGATVDNCHFTFFASKEKMERWTEGKRDGEIAATKSLPIGKTYDSTVGGDRIGGGE